MTTTKLTKAQREALEAVSRGEVSHWLGAGVINRSKGNGVTQYMLGLLVSKGLIWLRPTGLRSSVYELTPAGREALEGEE